MGQFGINTIESIALRMHAKWSPNTALDVGIDGHLEFFDPGTGRALGHVVAVQSKVNSGRLPGETVTTFEWSVRENDLDYWLSLNIPVLLIVVRSADEAYWIPIRESYGLGAGRRTRHTTVDKAAQAFTDAALLSILHVTAPPSIAGAISVPRAERLVSNLLRARVPGTLWVGDAPFSRARELRTALAEGAFDPRVWVLHGGRLLSFHDLTRHPWQSVLDQGSVDSFASSEWLDSPDPDRRRIASWLLTEALREQLFPEVRYRRPERVFAFRAGQPTLLPGQLGDWKIADPESGRRRTVFTSWLAKKDGHRIAYRHLAAELPFVYIEGSWYVAIVPTHIFTSDGRAVSRWHSAGLRAMKRLELNDSVRGYTRFWGTHLRREPMLAGPSPMLTFDAPTAFEVDFGIDEAAWRPGDPSAGQAGTLWEQDE